MARKNLYHSLIVFEDGEWSFQYGNHDREKVEAERDLCVVGYRCKRKHTFIITTGETQDEIEAGIEAVALSVPT